MGSYYQFQRYIDFEYITFDQLTLVANYICGNLNSPSFIFLIGLICIVTLQNHFKLSH